MDLHRSDVNAEWRSIPASQYNYWQRLAASTNGIVTPGNFTTAIGFCIAVGGIASVHNEHYLLGLIGIVVGRCFDLLDGLAADKTGTKSPLGEALDAGVDKLITLLTLIVLMATHLITVWMLLAIMIPHLLIGLLAGTALIKRQRLHPSSVGKVSMAFAWVALGGIVAAKAFANSSAIHSLSLLVGLTSVLLGLLAFTGYLRSYKH